MERENARYIERSSEHFIHWNLSDLLICLDSHHLLTVKQNDMKIFQNFILYEYIRKGIFHCVNVVRFDIKISVLSVYG